MSNRPEDLPILRPGMLAPLEEHLERQGYQLNPSGDIVRIPGRGPLDGLDELGAEDLEEIVPVASKLVVALLDDERTQLDPLAEIFGKVLGRRFESEGLDKTLLDIQAFESVPAALDYLADPAQNGALVYASVDQNMGHIEQSAVNALVGQWIAAGRENGSITRNNINAMRRRFATMARQPGSFFTTKAMGIEGIYFAAATYLSANIQEVRLQETFASVELENRNRHKINFPLPGYMDKSTGVRRDAMDAATLAANVIVPTFKALYADNSKAAIEHLDRFRKDLLAAGQQGFDVRKLPDLYFKR